MSSTRIRSDTRAMLYSWKLPSEPIFSFSFSVTHDYQVFVEGVDLAEGLRRSAVSPVELVCVTERYL